MATVGQSDAERARHAAVLARARRARQLALQRPSYHALNWSCGLGGCCGARRRCCPCAQVCWDSSMYVACATARGEPAVREELGLSIGSDAVRGRGRGQGQRGGGGKQTHAYGFATASGSGQMARDVPADLPHISALNRVKGMRRAALRTRNGLAASGRAQRLWGVLRARLSEALELYRAERQAERARARELWALLRDNLEEAVESYYHTRVLGDAGQGVHGLGSPAASRGRSLPAGSS